MTMIPNKKEVEWTLDSQDSEGKIDEIVYNYRYFESENI